MGWLKRVNRALRMELREHKSSFRVYMVLRLIVIGVLCFQIYNRNYESIFLCILTLILLLMPGFILVTLKIEFPTVLEIAILLFIFAAQVLGEMVEFYLIFPHWDTMLHTMNGFLMASIGLIDTMHDLIVNFIGAVIFSVIGFFYVKNQGKDAFIRNLIPRKKSKEKDYLSMGGDFL